MKNNYVGTVDKIRVIKSLPDMLVRFTLLTIEGNVNCIVSNKDLANQLLFLEDGKSEVALFGHPNKRKQLVIEKMMLRNPTSFELKFASGMA